MGPGTIGFPRLNSLCPEGSVTKGETGLSPEDTADLISTRSLGEMIPAWEHPGWAMGTNPPLGTPRHMGTCVQMSPKLPSVGGWLGLCPRGPDTLRGKT